MKTFITLFLALLFPGMAMASGEAPTPLGLTDHWVGYTAIIIFAIAYTFVIFEEQIHLRKSKPVLVAAGIIWILIAAYCYYGIGDHHLASVAIRHNFLEYAELFFFLLVAMTYINAMLERSVFDALRDWLVVKGFSYKALFWLTGILAFCISPIADNLTTALIMCAVVLAVGKGQPKFVAISCINIVVAANAGGAFSPFGDITTLMVWQKGVVPFEQFFYLVIPSIVNFVVPAACMHFALPSGSPASVQDGITPIKFGGLGHLRVVYCHHRNRCVFPQLPGAAAGIRHDVWPWLPEAVRLLHQEKRALGGGYHQYPGSSCQSDPGSPR